ncbi:MAG TPA: complex I subunit 1 family protein [Bdellovibrionota bacterium]|nr:complex I subunit 1 family protein [Bdellovibrionota bacterium]
MTATSSLSLWESMLGEGAPGWLTAVMGLSFLYAMIIFLAAFVWYLDRKLGADFQARVGPNRAGRAGILQPLADLLKLLQKEAIPTRNWREAIWLGIHTMALYSTVAVLPLGSLTLFVDTDMSAFLPFWAALVVALGTLMLGHSQRTVPGWFGGVRVATQGISGAFPALVALVCAGIHSGGFRWSSMATAQGAFPHQWTIVSDPFQFLAFCVFMISGLVLLSIPPMDAGHSLPDIHGGVASNLYGRRYVLFRLGRFYGFFLWSVIAVVLFLGAWVLPGGLDEAARESQSAGPVHFLELSWLLGKTILLMVLILWVARVNPRSRVDQITDFTWKVLSPFSLLALIGTALWTTWRSLA